MNKRYVKEKKKKGEEKRGRRREKGANEAKEWRGSGVKLTRETREETRSVKYK